MISSRRFLAVALVAAACLFSVDASAQVLEATLYGVVQDTSGAILPGVNVTSHQVSISVPLR